jgi:SAM-dependent methyltransferase
MWLPTFVCPECGGKLSGAWCLACARTYVERAGVWRFLTAAREARLEPFMRQYRLVCERECRRFAPDDYRSLPIVDRHHPHAAEWRIHRETYAHLLRRCFAHAPQQVRVLDLGGGCGWLSNRLAELGHRVVCLDLLDDDADGLGAAKHYRVPFAAVQADFDRLPFAPEQFDLVVFNGSLHYARDVAFTLRHARTVVAPDGALVVMDSPMFDSPADGDAMLERQPHANHGAGYLTHDDLTSAAGGLGLDPVFVESRGPLVWRTRRRLSRVGRGRSTPSFGMWVAQ